MKAKVHRAQESYAVALDGSVTEGPGLWNCLSSHRGGQWWGAGGSLADVAWQFPGRVGLKEKQGPLRGTCWET